MLRVDNTVIEARKALIDINTPFLSGRVEALCLEDALFDLMLGNVLGVNDIIEMDNQIMKTAGGVVTRAGSKKQSPQSLKVDELLGALIVGRRELIEVQQSDKTLIDQISSVGSDIRKRGEAEICYENIDDILYRIYCHPRVDFGKPRRQILVPTSLQTMYFRLHMNQS